ncbi:MAG: hypothetical protein OXI35_15230 [Gemmatimonadota bacterium]|nr:hypothetical protein [Gemmatimonadota bacterium]
MYKDAQAQQAQGEPTPEGATDQPPQESGDAEPVDADFKVVGEDRK